MARCSRLIKQGGWNETPADVVELDFQERHRRRLRLTGRQGLSFLLDLPRAVMLREGDGLRLDDGRLVAVAASAEPVMDVSAGSVRELSRLAWHIGNRHLPAEIRDTGIRLLQDHVIAEMLRGLGAQVREHDAPFNPEAGAYEGGGHGHGHGHHHHEHDHFDMEADER